MATNRKNFIARESVRGSTSPNAEDTGVLIHVGSTVNYKSDSIDLSRWLGRGIDTWVRASAQQLRAFLSGGIQAQSTVTFVEHRLGNVLLLKEQFKHSTLDMTQLYAANPMQNEALIDECLSELFEYKVEVIHNWLDDSEKMTGGAGKKISRMRANSFPDRASLLRETANKVSIRSTGHSWCLSQFAQGCGGQGLYERTRCAPCGSSVIDSTFQPIWREIYAHQQELRRDAHDLGPGTQQRVERDLSRARQVLTDLGVTDLPSVS